MSSSVMSMPSTSYSVTAQAATCRTRTSQISRRATPLAPVSRRSARLVVRAEEKVGPVEASNTTGPLKEDIPDSYERLEQPVRGGNIPDGGPPVPERMNAVDKLLVNNDSPQERGILGTAVAFPDAMRFKGAAPEVINSRLAMLGFVAAVVAEVSTGKNIIQQVQSNPQPIAATFLLFIVASLVPILRGVKRSGWSIWQPDAEIINGRFAMLGFALLLIIDTIKQYTS